MILACNLEKMLQETKEYRINGTVAAKLKKDQVAVNAGIEFCNKNRVWLHSRSKCGPNF